MQDLILTKKDGQVELSKPFDFICSQLPNGKYKVRIEKYYENRSISQNAVLWMWFNCIEDSTGTDKQDVHDYYCSKFLKRMSTINGNEVMIICGTSKLNTAQMADFMNKIKADSAVELGITLPLPSDLYYNDFINEYKYKR